MLMAYFVFLGYQSFTKVQYVRAAVCRIEDGTVYTTHGSYELPQSPILEVGQPYMLATHGWRRDLPGASLMPIVTSAQPTGYYSTTSRAVIAYKAC
jgi:hypothetical protein